jgi:type VI secretion system secreted protein VgrG
MGNNIMNNNYNKNFLDSLEELWEIECGIDKSGKPRVDIDGGLNDIKNDNGGITKYGISLRFFKNLYPNATKESIINLTKEDAINLYWNNFYINFNYDKINNFNLSRKLFLTAVNMGKNRPNRWIQQICNELGSSLICDGILGKISIEEINRLTDTKLKEIKEKFIKYQCDEYNNIVERNPTQKKFLKGWLKRGKLW